MKSVYIETSIPSYLTARPSWDVRATAWQQLTIQWWEQEKPKYELFTSELVLTEAGAGDPDAAKRRLDSLVDLPELTISDEVKVLAARLVADGGIPAHAEADALHVATASVHAMDYLLTWNCKHLANAAHRQQIETLVDAAGYVCPVICTPEELLED